LPAAAAKLLSTDPDGARGKPVGQPFDPFDKLTASKLRLTTDRIGATSPSTLLRMNQGRF